MSQQPWKANSRAEKPQPKLQEETVTLPGNASMSAARQSTLNGSNSSVKNNSAQNKSEQHSMSSNGIDASIKSWAHVAKGYNQMPAEGSLQNTNSEGGEVNNSGVKLPPGIKSEPSNHGSIKFGSIEPSDYQQTTTHPRQTGGAANQASNQGPSHGSHPKTAGQNPVTNSNKQNSSNAPTSRSGQGGNRVPRAPQQPVAVAGMPQPSPYATQSMATAYVLSPPGAPVSAYPQAYMLAYNPSAAAGSQSYYTGGSFAQGQYGAYNYGTTVPGPALGGNIPEVQNMQMASLPQTSTYMPNQSTASKPPQPTPVVQRQKRILRIENPDTHEVLDLAGIRADTDTKKTVPKDEAATDTAKEPEAKQVVEEVSSVKGAEKQTSIAPTVEDIEEKEADKTEKNKETEAKPSAVVDKETREVQAEEEKPVPEQEVSNQQAGEATAASEHRANEVPKKEEKQKRKYTNEFMLSIRHRCTKLPPNTETATLSALLQSEERPRLPPGVPERDWKSNRMPPGPGMGGPGMRGGRQASRKMTTGVDADVWERGRALPPLPGQFGGRGPPPGIRLTSGPLPALHKTESAYRVGRTATDDPDEEKAQKSLKSMLNKITPQNFEKITSQIVDKINERKKAKTLQGFIDQIFDKALTETTFSELYANLVASLNPALPSLEDEDGNPVQFRRTLLNKCQEEFERGVVAMKAVADREKRALTDTEKGNITEKEEGEIDAGQAAADAKSHEKEEADAEVKARKRMLGNIIFVGQLYRFGSLTETVMHSCIQQLLEETQNPRPEDVECLCKLLTTVGRPMDASTKTFKKSDGQGNIPNQIPTKEMMEIYFKRISDLAKNEALDSRHRFMLLDLIDLRKNSWVLRRKTEGPKKIEDIHRDAALERSRSQQLDRQHSRGGRDLPRGPPRPPFDNRVDAPIRIMNRIGSQDSLGSQSLRPGGRPPPQNRSTALGPTQPEVKPLSTSATDDKVKGLLAEFYSSRDMKEAILCVKELCGLNANLQYVVESALTVSLESKGTSWEHLSALFHQLNSEKVISTNALEAGIRQLLNKLDDLSVDVPKAHIHIGKVLADLIGEGVVDLKTIGRHILEADAEAPPEGEDTMMVSGGLASKLIGVILESLKTAKGERELAAAWGLTGLDYKDFLPSQDRSNPQEQEAFLAEYKLVDVL